MGREGTGGAARDDCRGIGVGDGMCNQSEAVVEVRHVVVRGIELRLVRRHDLEVLLVRDVERRASNPPLAVQCYFIVRKTDV